MPRYTDIDKLIAEYDRVHVGPAGGARKLMVEAPIADVAPRAEVAKEVLSEVYTKLHGFFNNYGDYEDIYGHTVRDYIDFAFEELKKKYAEKGKSSNEK